MRVGMAVVVVTGAASGIGRSTALAFARSRASMILTARREDSLRELVGDCQSKGVRAVAVPADVTDPRDVQAVADRAVEEFGRIDVWVNNAAVTFFSPFLDVPLDEFRRVLDVNVMGYVNGARAALSQMRAQGAGILVNVSSIVGVIPQPYTSAYSMSKAAIRAMGVSLRSELRLDGLRGVKVCSVLPGTVDTPFFRHAANYTGREVVAMPPVYPPQLVARAIVNVVRVPRREIVIGVAPRMILLQAKISPGLMERLMAIQVDKMHLSRDRPSPATSGNLHEPSGEKWDRWVKGGWDSRRRSAQRKAAAAGVLTAGILLARRRRRHRSAAGSVVARLLGK